MRAIIAALALVVMIPVAQADEPSNSTTQNNVQEIIENLQEWWQNLQESGSSGTSNDVVTPPANENGVCIQTVQGPSVCN